MGPLTTFLLLSGAALGVFTLEQSSTLEKRSAEGRNPLASFGESASSAWQSGLTGNFPMSPEKFGMGNTIPGMSPASSSGASAEKTKRSAEGGNPLASFGDSSEWQSQLSGLTGNFPMSPEKFGIGNTIPGISSATSSGASAEKTKRSAEGGNPLASFGDSSAWQSQLNGLTGNFPMSPEKFGMGNTIPGISSATSSGASAEKTKRSAEGGNPLASFGDSSAWQSQLNGLTGNFPMSPEKFGMGNTIPGISSATSSGASAEKTKRSAEGGNPLVSFGDSSAWQSQLNGLTGNFPMSPEKFGMGNTIPGISSATSSGASAEKTKRSAEGGNPLASFGDSSAWQSQLNGLTGNFPMSPEKFGMGNTIPGISSATSSGASAEKTKRSAEGGSPLASFGDSSAWQSQLNGLTGNFPMSPEKFGMGNTIPGFSSASSSGASAEKTKRSAEGGNALASFGDSSAWQSQLNGLTGNFPMSPEKFGMGNTIPGISSASSSGASAEKTKRSAEGGNPLASFGDSSAWQSQLNGLTGNFPMSPEKFGMGNTIPGISSASSSGASAEKTKRSAEGGNPLASFGDSSAWQSRLNGLTGNFPMSPEKFGMGNTIPGISSASLSGASAEKTKRSAEGGNPLASFGDSSAWQSQLNGLNGNFPMSPEKFGMGNTIPGINSVSSSGASAEKTKRSAEGGNPLASFGDSSAWQSQLNGLTGNFPMSPEKFGMGNTIPGISSASSSGASAEKTKRSAEGGNPLASFGDYSAWQSQLNGLTGNFPISPEKFGMGNTIPGISSASSNGASAEKTKRSNFEDSSSWTDKIKSLFNVNGAV